MILIVNLNPAIDRYLSFPRMVPGSVHRSRPVRIQAGGKGINVARCLSRWGIPATVLGFAGGFTGRWLQTLLETAGIDFHAIRMAGETRCCHVGFDEETGAETVWNEPGQPPSQRSQCRLVNAFDRLLPDAQAVILSGSAPPGVGADYFGELVLLAKQAGCPVLVDIPPLETAALLPLGPFLVKPNHLEAARLVGFSLESDSRLVQGVEKLIQLGARQVLITRGGNSAGWGEENSTRLLSLPEVPPGTRIFATGAGDATMAGCAAALVNGETGLALAQWGIASGTAYAVLGEACSWEDVKRFRER